MDTKYADYNVARLKRECSKRKIPVAITDRHSRKVPFDSDVLRRRLAFHDENPGSIITTETGRDIIINTPASVEVNVEASTTAASQPVVQQQQQQQQQTLQVTVPEGSSGGDVIEIQSPAGGMHQVQIPAGLEAGQVFEANVTDTVVVPVVAPAAPATTTTSVNVVVNEATTTKVRADPGATAQKKGNLMGLVVNEDAPVCFPTCLKEGDYVQKHLCCFNLPPPHNRAKSHVVMGSSLLNKTFRIEDKCCCEAWDCHDKIVYFNHSQEFCGDCVCGVYYCAPCAFWPIFCPFTASRDCVCGMWTNVYGGNMVLLGEDELLVSYFGLCYDRYVATGNSPPPAYSEKAPEASKSGGEVKGCCGRLEYGDTVGTDPCFGPKPHLETDGTVPVMFMEQIMDVVFVHDGGRCGECNDKFVILHDFNAGGNWLCNCACGAYHCSPAPPIFLTCPICLVRDCVCFKAGNQFYDYNNCFNKFTIVSETEVWNHCGLCFFDRFRAD